MMFQLFTCVGVVSLASTTMICCMGDVKGFVLNYRPDTHLDHAPSIRRTTSLSFIHRDEPKISFLLVAAVGGSSKKNTQDESSSSSRRKTTTWSSVRDVTLSKPMGIILEEIDESDPTAGVVIKSVDPKGAAATASKAGRADLCLRDVVLAVNGAPCAGLTFDTVMDRIVNAPGSHVTLTLGRPTDTVAVRWPNGVCVAATPGEYLGNIAQDAYMKIPYSCTSGSCGTCEQMIVTEDGQQRYVRPCVARVPRGIDSITVVPSDRTDSNRLVIRL